MNRTALKRILAEEGLRKQAALSVEIANPRNWTNVTSVCGTFQTPEGTFYHYVGENHGERGNGVGAAYEQVFFTPTGKPAPSTYRPAPAPGTIIVYKNMDTNLWAANPDRAAYQAAADYYRKHFGG
jgi:hypothetical protein